MKLSLRFALATLICTAAAYAGDAAPSTRPSAGDQPLAQAEAYLAAHSDKYLHHSKLTRGMKGYGLTVMAGTKIERFDAEIVSVMTKWGPHQDVILAKLSGLQLEKSGIIAGMSGSPVYMADPADGKYKLIGAVAYGWKAPKEPLCGIQPIVQMLATSDALDRQAATRPAGGAVASVDKQDYLRAVLEPSKSEFLAWAVGAQAPARQQAASAGPKLVPLATPLMASGLSRQAVDGMAAALEAYGMVPVQSGGVGGAQEQQSEMKLQPGSGIAIPLMSGDADLSAVGTVTDVIGDKVLAFGHSFFAEGQVRFPMGPAYIHTIVMGVNDSFKLGSTLGVTGVLEEDQNVAIAGRVGGKVGTIPVSVTVQWKDRDQSQQFHYRVVRHHRFTPMLMARVIENACSGWRDLPREHTVRYDVNADFGDLGKYQVSNISSNGETDDLTSDLLRPIVAVLNNPWIAPPQIKSIDIGIEIQDTASLARILELKLDGKAYRPGETVTGKALIEPFRKPREEVAISFELPKDLPLGQYTLEACDSTDSTKDLIREMPQKFDPQSLADLFQSVQTVAAPRKDALYVRLPLKDGGLAIARQSLPDLPESRRGILAQGRKTEIYPFANSIVRNVQCQYVLKGAAQATIEVTDNPKQVLTREP